MAEKKKGIVINIASAAAKHPFALLSLYSATKVIINWSNSNNTCYKMFEGKNENYLSQNLFLLQEVI